jgi:hypothetical protein
VNIGGMSADQALLFLQNTITYPQTGSLHLQYQTGFWEVTPEQIGVSFDPGTTLQNAYKNRSLKITFLIKIMQI